jgi:hypothetical protein
MPTEEELSNMTNEYIKNNNIIVYGCTDDNVLRGLIVLHTTKKKEFKILDIAVEKKYR